ncbi:hypothetical protein [Nocardia gipuzkoensis]
MAVSCASNFGRTGIFNDDLGSTTAAYVGRYDVDGSKLTLRAESGATATGTITAEVIELSGYRRARQ